MPWGHGGGFVAFQIEQPVAEDASSLTGLFDELRNSYTVPSIVEDVGRQIDSQMPDFNMSETDLPNFNMPGSGSQDSIDMAKAHIPSDAGVPSPDKNL